MLLLKKHYLHSPPSLLRFLVSVTNNYLWSQIQQTLFWSSSPSSLQWHLIQGTVYSFSKHCFLLDPGKPTRPWFFFSLSDHSFPHAFTGSTSTYLPMLVFPSQFSLPPSLEIFICPCSFKCHLYTDDSKVYTSSFWILFWTSEQHMYSLFGPKVNFWAFTISENESYSSHTFNLLASPLILLPKSISNKPTSLLHLHWHNLAQATNFAKESSNTCWGSYLGSLFIHLSHNSLNKELRRHVAVGISREVWVYPGLQ